jgi:hypothetical protein
MAKPTNVISQWCQLFENFQASSQDFYNQFEQAVEARGVPQLHWTRVEHKQGGLASGSREYLRMQRGKDAFDICAAPFGTGFFVSWWFTEPPLRFGFLYTLAFLIGIGIAANIATAIGIGIGAMLLGFAFGTFFGACFASLGIPILLWLLGSALRHGVIKGESTVLAMPLIGWIYEKLFAPPTFYSIDTALMFQKSVHNAVLEVVDCMTANRGIRALSEAERKPILKQFAASA